MFRNTKKYITSFIIILIIAGSYITRELKHANLTNDSQITTELTHDSVQQTPPTGTSELLDIWVNQTQNLYNHQTLNNNNKEYYMPVDPSITVDSNTTNDIITDKGWNVYQGIDSKGRTGAATALITYDVVNYVASLDRPDFAASTIVPGQYTKAQLIETNKIYTWKKTNDSKSNNFKTNMSINNVSYNGYAFNKSHLIAWSLGGDMLDHNLIWGTRAQNVGSNYSKNPGGMSYIETLVRNYIHDNHNAKILYTTVPIYKTKNDIVPIAVYVEAIDTMNPEGFSHAAWTLNQQDGLIIDYTTGHAEIAK